MGKNCWIGAGTVTVGDYVVIGAGGVCPSFANDVKFDFAKLISVGIFVSLLEREKDIWYNMCGSQIVQTKIAAHREFR